ncbi:hypothetical protein V865_006917 [Kwoniella europaea PYCC6329]|uniref:Aminoglycoside phosphotransferase domain-containing protein n=1 Tax=Kwoniella europaea PYCC6329 TaxID=1423913 RepID=A0AAX4KRZ1_9TREE
MRVRRRAVHMYPDGPLELNLMSEVATNRGLSKAGVAVPTAYPRPKNSKLHPRLLYCYQDWLPGDTWRPFMSTATCHLPLDATSVRHVNSIVEWFLSMEKCSFEKVGSLCFDDNDQQDIVIGPLIERHPAYTVPPYFRGPFNTPKERWIATIDNRIALILSRNYCSSNREVKHYLALKAARQLVQNCKQLDNSGPFYIKHDDDKFDHIKAQADGQVTGILDWEWAYTTNKEEAFAAPNGFVSAEYIKGKNDQLSPREHAMIDAYISRGRPDLAECVRKGRKYHRLVDLFRDNVINISNINALERAFLDLPDDYVGQSQTIEQWVELMKEKYKDDEGLRSLLGTD